MKTDESLTIAREKRDTFVTNVQKFKDVLRKIDVWIAAATLFVYGKGRFFGLPINQDTWL